jgi:hypothetical protein
METHRMMLPHMLRRAALHAIDVYTREQRASPLYLQRISHETSWERGCAMLAHPISLEKRGVSFREIVDERTEIPVRASNAIYTLYGTDKKTSLEHRCSLRSRDRSEQFQHQRDFCARLPQPVSTEATPAFAACLKAVPVPASCLRCATRRVARCTEGPKQEE